MICICLWFFSQINIQADIAVTLSYSYPGSNLFLIHPGFTNPALGHGIIGFATNPASLTNTGKFEFMATAVPQMSTLVDTRFDIPFDTVTPFIDTVHIPAELDIRQYGGFDFVGIALSIKDWGLGIGYQKGDYLGLDFTARSNPFADYGLDFEYTFTHEDINEIPIGYAIPVQIQFNAAGDLAFSGEGEGHFAMNSLVIGVARTLLGVDCGLGLHLTPVSLTGHINGLFDGYMTGSGRINVEAVDDWEITAVFDAEIDADSILTCLGDIDVSFALSTLTWGIRKEWRSVSLGLCGEFNWPTFINGDYGLVASLPRSVPLIRIDDDNLVVDTVNHIISGHALITVHDFEKGDSVYQDAVNTLFLGTAGALAGIGVRFWRFETGLFGGLSISSDNKYLKLRTGLNLGFNTFVPIRGGIIFHFQYYDIKGIPMSALPVISFGAGTDFSIGNFDIFVNVTGNTTQGAGSFIIPDIIGGEKKHSTLLCLGMGTRFRI
jgi:hypothetical protein